MRQSIRRQLGLAFIGLALGPVLLVAGAVAWQGFHFHRERALGLQQERAKRLATQVQTFIEGLEGDLSMLIEVRGLCDMGPGEQQALLSELLSYEDAFAELALLDRSGRERLRLSRLEVVGPADLRDRGDADEFQTPQRKGKTYYSPVRFAASTGEPLMTLAKPVVDARTGEPDGVLVADVRLKFIWNLMARTQVAEGEDLFIVDAQSRLIAHRDPSVVLRGTRYDLPEEPGITKGLSGQYACLAFERVRLGDQEFAVVVERGLSLAMREYLANSLFVAVCVLLPALLAGHLVARRVARRIVGPIRELSGTAKAIERGDLMRQAEVVRDDEIGDLAQSFNSMTGQFRLLLQSLEQEVAERHQAEEAQFASEQRYRVLLQSMPQPVFHKDLDSVFVSCNPSFARALGCERPEEVVGKTDYDFFPKELADKYRADDRRVMDTNQIEEHEEPFVREGEERTVLVVKAPLKDDSGHVAGLLGTMWDITERKQAEEALRKSEGRFQQIAENAQEWIWEVDGEGLYTYASSAVEQLLGYKPEQVVGKRHFYDLFVPEEREQLKRSAFEIFARKEPFRGFVNRNVRKDGDIVWLLTSGVAILDEAGELLGYRGVDTDITERTRAEQALRASEERYRTLIENLPQSIFHKDRNSAFISCNQSFAQDLGVTPEEVVGKTDYDFFPRDLAEKYRADDQRIMASGVAEEIEERHVRQDEEIFVHVVKTPLRDDAGDVAGLLGIFWDITERKKAEEALRESEARYRLLAENVSDVIWTMDLDLNFTYVSPSVTAVEGFTVEEAMARPLEDHLAPHSLELVRRIYEEDKERFSSGLDALPESRTIEIEHRRKDGTMIWSEVTVSLLRDDADRPAGILGVSRDITQRKRLQAQIQHAQKLESLAVLAGGIAHDFNNLLMGILGNASLVLMQMDQHAALRRNVEQIETAGMRAAELAKQMLAYSGKGKLVVEPINLSGLVGEMAHLLEAAISKKAVLKYDFAESIPIIEGDATQLRQVVMNLITNASEALEDKSGVISINTCIMEADRAYLSDTYVDDQLPAGFYVYLEVSDTGAGMDEETRRRIFDPFFTTKFMGRGLGLAAVLGIIRGHKGAIRVYSEPQKGTTFKVLFPCSEQSAKAEVAEVKTEDDWRGHGTILVVDDEKTVRSVAKMMLEAFGFDVLTADDGAEAVAVYREHADEIRAVLLDMTMPRLSGEQAFTELRRVRPDVCVVLSSGYNEQEATEQFAGKGLAGFIQKPYQAAALIQKLREVLPGTP